MIRTITHGIGIYRKEAQEFYRYIAELEAIYGKDFLNRLPHSLPGQDQAEYDRRKRIMLGMEMVLDLSDHEIDKIREGVFRSPALA